MLAEVEVKRNGLSCSEGTGSESSAMFVKSTAIPAGEPNKNVPMLWPIELNNQKENIICIVLSEYGTRAK